MRSALFEALEERTFLSVTSSLVYPGPDGHLVYVPNAQGDVIPNFSQVGYETGVVPLPDTPSGYQVPVAITLSPTGGDQTAIIQNAINSVSAMPLNSSGFRGAILLTAGNYQIAGSLNITASGVVLEGQGESPTTGTRLEATGTSTRVLINITGSGSRHTVANTTHNITDNYVPVGATSFDVDSTAGLSVGQTVIVERPSTQAWIDAIGMNLLANPWTPGSKNLLSDRVITAINGNQITIDAPLTNSLDQQYGGGTIYAYTWPGRISQVGLENFYAYSDEASNSDPNHSNGVLSIDSAENVWVNDVTANQFALNVMELGDGVKWMTIDNTTIENSTDTTTNINDAPAGIGTSAQETLIENITFINAFHAIAAGATFPGPDVYYNINITNPAVDPLVGSHTREETGPHQRWSTGGLFDNVTSTDYINIRNAANEGSGHGWQGANYVIWNSNARTDVSSPPTAQNWVIGGSAKTSEGTAIYDQRGQDVTPQSLYIAQLLDRETPTVQTPAAASPNPINVGDTTTLTALGADAAGESTLLYSWSTISMPSGAAAPTFSSSNGTNAGKSTVATITTSGEYTFRVTIQFPGGFSVTSDVNVLSLGVTRIVVTPATAAVAPNGTQAFTATAFDAAGNVLQTQPTFTWSLLGSSVGSIDASGNYTAGSATGVAIIQAAYGSISGVAAIAVTEPGVAIVDAASANPTPVTGTTTELSVSATENGSAAGLTYSWSAIAEPAGASVVFSDNADETALDTTATFAEAGDYTFLVEVSDGANLAVSSVEVPVAATLSKLESSPSSVQMNLGATQQFAVSGFDQFGNTWTSALTPTWSVNGGGNINASTGLFAANAAAGTFTVTVTDDGLEATSAVTIFNNLLIGAFEGAVSTPIPGASQSIAYQLRNVGGITLQAPFTIDIYQETGATLGDGDVLLGTNVVATGNLTTGASMSEIAGFTLPDYGGQYYLVGAVFGGVPGAGQFQLNNTFASAQFNDAFNFSLGTLTLAGGNSGPSSLSASKAAHNMLLTLNGTQEPSTPLASVDALVLDAGSGSSSIDVAPGITPVIVRDASLNDFLTLESGTITVTAAPSGANVIQLLRNGASLMATENSLTASVSLTNVNAIYVNGGGGSDSITIGSALPAVTLKGGSGSDTVSVQNTAGDRIVGGASDNYLIGGAGADTLKGGAGVNTIAAGSGIDSLVGGSGDNFFINGNATGGEIRGGSGMNFAQENAAEQMSNITEFYDARAGSASFAAPTPVFGASVLAKVVSTPAGEMLKVFGTPGNDTIDIISGGTDLLVESAGAEVGAFALNGLSGVRIFGGAGNDVLGVNANVTVPVTMRGGAGDDSLSGGGGDNLLIGGGGDDTLTGGSGVSLLVPGKRNFSDAIGDDVLIGGTGLNIADFSRRTDDLVLKNDGLADSGDAVAGEAITIMPSVQVIWGGSGDDTVVGTTAGNFLSGGSGNASIQGTSGGDLLTDGLGKDTVSAASPAAGLFVSSQTTVI